MKPLAILCGVAVFAAAGCEQTGTAESQTEALDDFADPSPYANPVEARAEPTDGFDNEIGD